MKVLLKRPVYRMSPSIVVEQRTAAEYALNAQDATYIIYMFQQLELQLKFQHAYLL